MISGTEILGAALLAGFGASAGWHGAKMIYVFIMAQFIKADGGAGE